MSATAVSTMNRMIGVKSPGTFDQVGAVGSAMLVARIPQNNLVKPAKMLFLIPFMMFTFLVK